MAFIHREMPSPWATIGQGIGEGIQGTLGNFLGNLKQKREINKLQSSLDALGPDASAFEKLTKISASPASEQSKKMLLDALHQEELDKYVSQIQEEGLTPDLLIKGMGRGFVHPGAGVELLRGAAGTRERESAQKIFQKPFEKTQEAAEAATKRLASSRRLSEILERNPTAFGPLTWDNLVTKLGFPGAASTEAQEFQSGLLDFLEGERARFGVRLTDADLKIIQNKLPDIARSLEGNKAILKLRESESLFSKLKQQAQNNVLRRNKGFTYDFNQQVEDELGQLLNQFPDVERYYESSVQDLLRLAEKEKTEKTSPATEFEKLPPPHQFTGKIMEDDKGNRFKSDGKRWRKI